MEIRWSPRASAEFDAIFEYLITQSASAAIPQARLILKAVRQLEIFPASARSGKVRLTRELVVPGTPYIVYYSADKTAVNLLSTKHSARRKPNAF